MPPILVTQYPARNTDTSRPWTVVVDDDAEDEAQWIVVLPDDFPAAPDDVDSPMDAGTTDFHAGCGTPPVAAVLIPSSDPLDDLSVPSTPWTFHPRSFDHLDHGDPEEAMAHPHLFPVGMYRRLRTGLNKIEAYPKQFARPDDHHRENLSLIALSNWDYALRYCLCGIRNALCRSQPCRLWNLCPACSYLRRKRGALSAYLTRFRRTSWYFVTISYVVDLGAGILDEEIVRACWRAASSGLRDHQHAGYSRGAMSRLEMHLERFLPLQYLAHLHAIVDADRIDQPFLADRVFAYRHPGTGERVNFLVSITDRPLRSEKGFANALSYVGKALDLATAYRAAWPRAAHDQRRLVPSLNQEVNEFLDAFSVFTSDAHQVCYGGTLHARARDSLRVPQAQRAAQREQVDAILADCTLDPWDDNDAKIVNVFDPPAL